MRSTTPATVAKARTLRRTMTKREAALWQLLRTRPGNLKFRRQHPVGPFVLDLYCSAAKLAIGVDGIAHYMGDNPERDEGRDSWLQEQGFRILRVSAAEVLTNIEGVTRMIVDTALSSLSRSHGEGNRTQCGGGAREAGDPQ